MIKLEKLEKGEFFKDAFLVSYRYNKDYLNKMRSLKYKRYPLHFRLHFFVTITLALISYPPTGYYLYFDGSALT